MGAQHTELKKDETNEVTKDVKMTKKEQLDQLLGRPSPVNVVESTPEEEEEEETGESSHQRIDPNATLIITAKRRYNEKRLHQF